MMSGTGAPPAEVTEEDCCKRRAFGFMMADADAVSSFEVVVTATGISNYK